MMIESDTIGYYLRAQRVLIRQWEIGEIRRLCLIAGWDWAVGERLIAEGKTPRQVCELFLAALTRPAA
jgi:hypothetical protein